MASIALPQGPARPAASKRVAVSVDGVEIPREAIAREAQNHSARNPGEAWAQAARALVVRELLLGEAARLGIEGEPMTDADGRRETEEEATIRALVESEARTPEPDEATCRRYFEQNQKRFRSPDIFEAAHILFAAVKHDAEAYAAAEAAARAALAHLQQSPGDFAALAAAHSACPSAAQCGNLGQIGRGDTTAEFEAALVALQPGAISPAPVATRYGFHVIRLDRRIDGAVLPFELVKARIADYLVEAVERRALAQYVSILAARAAITGVNLAPNSPAQAG